MRGFSAAAASCFLCWITPFFAIILVYTIYTALKGSCCYRLHNRYIGDATTRSSVSKTNPGEVLFRFDLLAVLIILHILTHLIMGFSFGVVIIVLLGFGSLQETILASCPWNHIQLLTHTHTHTPRYTLKGCVVCFSTAFNIEIFFLASYPSMPCLDAIASSSLHYISSHVHTHTYTFSNIKINCFSFVTVSRA